MTDPRESLAAYNEYRKLHPDQFVNSPGTAFEIVFDEDLQLDAGAGIAYQDDYLILLRDAVRFRDGQIRGYTRVLPAAGQGGAAVLPIIDGRIVLLRHERHATRQWHWEIPRGFAHPGEGPAETAWRELSEELGTAASGLQDIGSVRPDTGASSGSTRMYLGSLAGTGQLEVEEGIDGLKLVTPGEFDAMVRSEEITDSFTLAAVLQARVRGLLD